MLNSELIRQRRRDLNLSYRQLGRELKVSGSVLRRLEEGVNHEWITLGEIRKLSTALAMDLADMFDGEAIPAGGQEMAGKRVADLRRLLHEMNVMTPRSALYRALECTPDELDEALDWLTVVLAPAGMTVHRSKDKVSIEPAVTTDVAPLRRLIRDQSVRRGLMVSEANVLVQVINGTLQERSLGKFDNVALQRFRKAGIVETDGLELTPEAKESLLM